MNPHFVEMLRCLRDEHVEHLVIGAHALAAGRWKHSPGLVEIIPPTK